MPNNSPPSATTPIAPRLLLGALALLLALASGLGWLGWMQNRQQLTELVGPATGKPTDPARQRLRRERTPLHARILACRILINDVMAAPALDKLPTSEHAAQIEERSARLQQAKRLARQVLAEQPSSWEATLFLGAATYLDLLLRQDPRLFTEASSWEAPLEKALADASGQPEPARFLVTTYLELWHALSAAKRERAYQLLVQVFERDPEAFARLVPTWLQLADNVEEAFAPLPENPAAWAQVTAIYAQQGNWRTFKIAERRRLDSLEQQLRRDLDEALQRLRKGDVYNSRQLFMKVLSTAPLEQRFAPLFSEALHNAPAGIHDQTLPQQLHRWLAWTLELADLGQQPLTSDAFGRLWAATGKLPPAQAARAALYAGDLHTAERFERRADTLSIRAWAPYLLAKIHLLTDRGLLEDAARAKRLVDPASRQTAGYWLATAKLAEAQRNPQQVAEASGKLQRLGRDGWLASDWTATGGVSSLLFFPAYAASGLEIELDQIPQGGNVARVALNGVTVALEPVWPGRRLRLDLEVSPTSHLLQLSSATGAELTPGRVRLRLAKQR